MEPPARRSVGGSSLHDVSRVSLLFRQQFPVALITIMLVIPTLLLEKAKQEVEHLGLIIQEQTRLLNRLGTWSIKAAGRFDLLSKYDIPFRYFETLETACREHDLDLDFMIALMKVESNFDPLATSTQNAYGLMQIQVPGNWIWNWFHTGNSMNRCGTSFSGPRTSAICSIDTPAITGWLRSPTTGDLPDSIVSWLTAAGPLTGTIRE